MIKNLTIGYDFSNRTFKKKENDIFVEYYSSSNIISTVGPFDSIYLNNGIYISGNKNLENSRLIMFSNYNCNNESFDLVNSFLTKDSDFLYLIRTGIRSYDVYNLFYTNDSVILAYDKHRETFFVFEKTENDKLVYKNTYIYLETILNQFKSKGNKSRICVYCSEDLYCVNVNNYNYFFSKTRQYYNRKKEIKIKKFIINKLSISKTNIIEI